MTITDLYNNLFGKGAIQDGTVIDMAEHGRAGGVSTGSGYKSVKDIEEKVLIDVVDDTTTYIGRAKMGGAVGDTVWQIKKILTSGTVTSFSFADGNDNYDNEWDERANYTYS